MFVMLIGCCHCILPRQKKKVDFPEMRYKEGNLAFLVQGSIV